MKPRKPSIVDILFDRERGYRSLKYQNNLNLNKIGAEYAENTLLERLKNEDLYQPVGDLVNETQSVFNVEQSHNGYHVATVQTNRSINIYKVTSMKKIVELHTNDRSVWTLAFHPHYPNTIAVGTLGAQISIFVDGKECAKHNEKEINLVPIASICFHPVEDYVVYSASNSIKIFDWKTNTIVHTFYTFSDCTFRYLKFNPRNLMLITGISKTSLFVSVGIGKNLITVECQNLILSFLRTLNLILDCLEYCPDYKYTVEINKKSHLWNYLMKTISYRLVDLKIYDAENRNFVEKNVDLTLNIINRRIDLISQSINKTSVKESNINEVSSKSYYMDVLAYFRTITSGLLMDKDDSFFRYSFDLSLMESILFKVYKLFFTYGSTKFWENQFQYNYQYYQQSLYSNDIQDKIEINYQRNTNLVDQYTLQAWKFDVSSIPDFKEDWRNVITTCYINNDSTVSISNCNKFIASVVSGKIKQLEVRSLEEQNLGECFYTFKFATNFVSISFSPSSKYLLLGVRCSRKTKFAYVLDKDVGIKTTGDFKFELSINNNDCSCSTVSNNEVGLKQFLPKNEVLHYNEINCIKWATHPGYGIFLGLKSNFLKTCRLF